MQKERNTDSQLDHNWLLVPPFFLLHFSFGSTSISVPLLAFEASLSSLVEISISQSHPWVCSHSLMVSSHVHVFVLPQESKVLNFL